MGRVAQGTVLCDNLNSTQNRPLCPITYTYDAWGYIYDISGELKDTLGMLNPLRYRGYVYDSEPELYYLQSRYYDPWMKRFISADVMVATGQGLLGNNMYAYCRNNPVIRKDASGTDDLSVTEGDEYESPLDDIGGSHAASAGPSNYGSAYNPIDAGYSYHVDLTIPSNSSFLNGGTYGGGAIGYGTYSNPTGGMCFVADTLVYAENDTIPIQDISAGDKVWAWDEQTGTVALKEVVETYINETDELIHIFVSGEEIITTPSHPFYSPVKGWTKATHLRAGDILVLVNGEYVVVERVQHEILEAPVTVYNFQVEDYHTYFVADAGVLVHNSCQKFSTTKDAAKVANSMGYSKVKGQTSHGQAIFHNSKALYDLRFISADTDSHHGGTWKAASSITGLYLKETRSGTYNWDLSIRIGD